jgi:hypothetical protein
MWLVTTVLEDDLVIWAVPCNLSFCNYLMSSLDGGKASSSKCET